MLSTCALFSSKWRLPKARSVSWKWPPWLYLISELCCLTLSAQNLLQNPGFEAGTTGWQSYSDWAPMTTTTNFPHSGLRAALVYSRPNTYAGPSQSLLGILQPGQTYVCSAWTRVERGDNQPTKVTMRQIDGRGTRWIGLGHGVAYSNRWTFLSGTFTLDVVGTLTDLTLYFEDPAAGVDYLLDDASVTLPFPPPPAPVDLVSRAGDGSVVLHWDRGSERQLAGYHVYRGTNVQGPFTRLTANLVPITSFADLTVTNGQLYFYRLSAIDLLQQKSTNSMTVSALPRAFTGDSEFLDYIQQTAFDYFWYEANPINGLIRDRSRSNAVASIAATGFGLTAMAIGVERGWLAPEQGRERVLATLRTLWEKPQGPAVSGNIGYRGWYYQYLDMEGGVRTATSSISSLDTALLLAGVLSAKAYFNGDNPLDVKIGQLADNIYNRVDWSWMGNGDTALAIGWSPESGFNLARWTGYNEALLLYVLGLGAVTNPLPSGCWERWTSGYAWQTNYGYSHVVCPPLSGHEYAQCWLDLRHVADGWMNGKALTYFENSRRAILAQRAYTTANPGGFAGYGPLVWGLTQSDGPGTNRYLARGAPPAQNDDGTIAPSAVAAALPFAPEYALPALRHFYDKWCSSLWTGYGFRDAFNLQSNWWAPEVIGLEQGAMAVMLENYRSQRVWSWFMGCAEVQRGLAQAGFVPLRFLSLNCELSPGHDRLVLWWDAALGRIYQIEYSEDLHVWSPTPELLQASSGSLGWEDRLLTLSGGLAPRRFYRIFMLGPP